ncbi:MAG: hypothetical protein AB7S66_00510 [Sphaerochaeta sp.]|uniref:hypothetical protein n=3 Tax=Sphaerochaeta sp. TaxID=1972642 RepID=UPI003D11C081
MKRKFITVLAVLILLPAFLFAVPVVVTWEWLLEDPLVTTFRYQVDGEEEDNWTVVDSSVTSYTERGLDGTVDHTLYLQQSYDGVHFSESAISVAEAMFPPEEEVPVVASEPVPAVEEMVAEEPVPVAEEVVAEEPAPVAEEVVAEEPTEEVVPLAEEVVAEEPAEEVVPVAEEVVAEEPAKEVVPVAEEVVAEEPVPVTEEVVAEEPAEEAVHVAEEPVEEKKEVESRSRTTLTMGGTFNFQNPDLNNYHRYNLQAELGVHMENLVTFNDSLGLGIDLGLAYSPYLESAYGWRNAATDALAFDLSTVLSNFDHAITISVAPMLNISMGKTDFDIGLGGFLTWGPELATDNGDEFLYGAFAKAALEYHFNKTFSMGASAKYGLILSEGTSSMPQFAEGTVYMGFSF